MGDGGVTGMGRAIATELARAGANVAVGSLMDRAGAHVTDVQRATKLVRDDFEAARSDLESHGVGALAVGLDVCSNDSVEAFYDQTIETFGTIDILVNAAGTFMFNHLMVGHPDNYWFRTIDANLNGPYRTIKSCLPAMIEQRWGRIVNVASTAANVGADDHAAYCASKGGLLGLTRCIALEGAPHGVTCNTKLR